MTETPERTGEDTRLWRVGNHQPQNIYEDDRYVGVTFDASWAATIVRACNEPGAFDGNLVPEQSFSIGMPDVQDIYSPKGQRLAVAFDGADALRIIHALNRAAALGWKS